MNAVELVMYGALIGVALMNVGPFWRARRDNPAGWSGVGVFMAVAAFAALRVAVALDARTIWIIGLQLIAVSGPFWFWRLARALFEDGYAPQPWHWALLLALELLFAGRLLVAPLDQWTLIAGRILAIAVVAHSIWYIARDARNDLMETRVKARGQVIVIAGALAILTLSWPGLSTVAPVLADVLRRLTPLIDIVLIATAGRTFFRLEREVWPPRPPRVDARAEPVDRDAADLERLDALMSVEKVWKEPGLTVAKLAERLRLPEYRLRRLILERRGARNFNAYLADYRLAEAAARLADSSQARAPITTIAYDCGFASLGPFNRAFRERYGVTPTSYRKGDRAAASGEFSPNL